MAPPSHQGTTEALPVHTRTASASVADDTRVLVRADALKRSGIPTGAHVLLRSTHAPTPLWAGTVWPDFDPQAPGVSVPSLSADPLSRDVVVACVREAPTVPRLTVALDAAPTPLLHALLMHTLVDMGAVALHRAWRITLLGHVYEARPLRPSNATSDVVRSVLPHPTGTMASRAVGTLSWMHAVVPLRGPWLALKASADLVSCS